MEFMGVLLFGAVISLIMSIVAPIKYLHLKKTAIPGIAVIGKQKGAPSNDSKHTTYLFDFTIVLPDKNIEKIYKDIVGKNRDSRVKPGDEFPIFWDVKKESYVEVCRLKKNMLEAPIVFAACVLAFFLCAFISWALM